MDGSLTCPAAGEPARAVRVVLSDDECLFRACLRQLLAVPPPVLLDVYGVDVGPGFQVVGEAGSGEETVRLVKALEPDLLLLDLCMPRMSGLDALRELAPAGDHPRTILLAGGISRTNLLSAIHLGVRGLILKDSPTEVLFEAIMGVIGGRYWLDQTLVTDLLETTRSLIQSSKAVGGQLAFGLTPREREVLSLVVAGCANKDIAHQCAVSEDTIKHHLTRIFNKVGASNRLELAMFATERGLLDSSTPEPRAPSI